MGTKSPLQQEIDARLRGYIRREMVKANLEGTAMARHLGVNQSQLSRTLRSRGGVSTAMLVQLCAAFELESKAALKIDPGKEWMREGWVPKPDQTPPEAPRATGRPEERRKHGPKALAG